MKLSALSFAALAASVQPRGNGGLAPAAPPSKKEEMAARKLQSARDAVATLAMVKTRSKDDEKARAAEKVKQLKARLQALKMLYAGDPKKLAKAAAQIARELAGAVKSYVSAGGNAGDLGGAADAGAPAASAGPVEGMEGNAQGSVPAESTETPTKDAAGGDKADAKPDGAAPGLGTSDGGKSAAQTARDKADEDFKNEVRDLARALKAALRRKERRDDDDDRRSGEQALATVDQAVGALPIADVGAVSALAGI
ncbi:hypothetical protein ACNFJ7_08795 [Sphingomonas sp. HT-1]|uniref:hypothetical protein n=1 Tax=unclassified Sphingomonas TaxID=196159 RepID=UPI0002D5AB1E|nr:MULTISPECIES: hypothetical protein [unclassified Sphingomonas]KTF68474.1 hypothetical protein ATB93_13650 [Sphingomonas sp. WG]